ncbi:hypothetical protein VP01_3982g2 [Puccinia sorghi]|uniref:Uncharacterized protein n=1 Tax=Puccinia sorghi TaxID=27349 RepID=A0A0L6USA0_9BASI|nr:hypothetical protein VP01_3982g2 [Puccinia sorghi]
MHSHCAYCTLGWSMMHVNCRQLSKFFFVVWRIKKYGKIFLLSSWNQQLNENISLIILFFLFLCYNHYLFLNTKKYKQSQPVIVENKRSKRSEKNTKLFQIYLRVGSMGSPSSSSLETMPSVPLLKGKLSSSLRGIKKDAGGRAKLTPLFGCIQIPFWCGWKRGFNGFRGLFKSTCAPASKNFQQPFMPLKCLLTPESGGQGHNLLQAHLSSRNIPHLHPIVMLWLQKLFWEAAPVLNEFLRVNEYEICSETTVFSSINFGVKFHSFYDFDSFPQISKGEEFNFKLNFSTRMTIPIPCGLTPSFLNGLKPNDIINLSLISIKSPFFGGVHNLLTHLQGYMIDC